MTPVSHKMDRPSYVPGERRHERPRSTTCEIGSFGAVEEGW